MPCSSDLQREKRVRDWSARLMRPFPVAEQKADPATPADVGVAERSKPRPEAFRLTVREARFEGCSKL